MSDHHPQPGSFGPAPERQPSAPQQPAPVPSAEPYAAADPYAPAGYAYHPEYPQHAGYPAGAGYGYGYWPHAAPPAPPAPPRKRHRALVSIGAAAVAAALVLGGYGIGSAVESNQTVAGSASGSGDSGSGATANGGAGTGLFPNATPGGTGGTQGGSSSQGGTTASSTQQAGIVTINSVLKYENAQSAGTGMILTSNGEVLTNNHVVNGATSVTVTDESTGKSYRADVVGTSPSSDVAVLQLRNASGLTTAKVGDASDVSDVAVGDKVTGVGNANGTGTLTQVSGAVTALEQKITATDESGSDAETLTGLIQTDAAIVSGDSGGPLYDSDGTIIGINTAASTANASLPGSGSQTAAEAYAIPIDDALKVADQIESGIETSSVHIGLPAFIGVGVGDSNTGGAAITSVLEGGPADGAGITSGSTITAVGGKAVTGADSLKSVLGTYKPGQKVSISWTDETGTARKATVTLIEGPAD